MLLKISQKDKIQFKSPGEIARHRTNHKSFELFIFNFEVI